MTAPANVAALRARLADAHRTAAALDAAANAAASAAGGRIPHPPAVHLADAAALSAAARVASLSARLFDADGDAPAALEARRYAADLFAAAARARRHAARASPFIHSFIHSCNNRRIQCKTSLIF